MIWKEPKCTCAMCSRPCAIYLLNRALNLVILQIWRHFLLFICSACPKQHAHSHHWQRLRKITARSGKEQKNKQFLSLVVSVLLHSSRERPHSNSPCSSYVGYLLWLFVNPFNSKSLKDAQYISYDSRLGLNNAHINDST